MRQVPGWVGGALGAGALVSAFYLGGRVGAAAPDHPAPTARADALPSPAPLAPADTLQVRCAPGQRAVVSTPTGAAPTVTCVNEAQPVLAGRFDAPLAADPPIDEAVSVPVRVAAPVAVARPAVLTAPTEVYQPRPRRTTSEARGDVAPARRTWERSAVIIGSSAAVGATVGGLTKGKKGAVIGGLVGGGAATVWDQVTRRRGDEVNRR